MSMDLIHSPSTTAATDDELKLEVIAYFSGFTSFKPHPDAAVANIMACVELLRGMSRQAVYQGRLAAARKAGAFPMSAGEFWRECVPFARAEEVRNEPEVIPPSTQHVESDPEADRRVQYGLKDLAAELSKSAESSNARRIYLEDARTKALRQREAEKELAAVLMRGSSPVKISDELRARIVPEKIHEAAE